MTKSEEQNYRRLEDGCEEMKRLIEQEEWSPEKRALAAQWLVEKRLEKIRGGMPPEVFVQWALSLELLLDPWERYATRAQ